MKAPLTADVLDSLRHKAQRLEGFPASLADVLVPAHWLLELCDGYAPGDRARMDALEGAATTFRTDGNELVLQFGVKLSVSETVRAGVDRMIADTAPAPKPGELPADLFAPLDHGEAAP